MEICSRKDAFIQSSKAEMPMGKRLDKTMTTTAAARAANRNSSNNKQQPQQHDNCNDASNSPFQGTRVPPCVPSFPPVFASRRINPQHQASADEQFQNLEKKTRLGQLGRPQQHQGFCFSPTLCSYKSWLQQPVAAIPKSNRIEPENATRGSLAAELSYVPSYRPNCIGPLQTVRCEYLVVLSICWINGGSRRYGKTNQCNLGACDKKSTVRFTWVQQ